MSLAKYIITDFKDPAWIDDAINKQGDNFWKYKEKIFKYLQDMKPNTSVNISDIVKEENENLFMKIACCFIQTNTNYYFRRNYEEIVKEPENGNSKI